MPTRAFVEWLELEALIIDCLFDCLFVLLLIVCLFDCVAGVGSFDPWMVGCLFVCLFVCLIVLVGSWVGLLVVWWFAGAGACVCVFYCIWF